MSVTKKPKKKLKHAVRELSDVQHRIEVNTVYGSGEWSLTPMVSVELVRQLNRAHRRLRSVLKEIRKSKKNA